MGGVGSFARQNRTLYVGRIKETGTGPETEEVVKRHFKEWGEIEKSAYQLTRMHSTCADTQLLNSSCLAIPQCGIRHVCLGRECPVR